MKTATRPGPSTESRVKFTPPVVPLTISSLWEFMPNQGTPGTWVEEISHTCDPGVATKEVSSGAVMRAASPRAKVREAGSTHCAGALRSSFTRATSCPFSIAGPRSKCPSVAFPEAPEPTLKVRVVRAVFGEAWLEVSDACSSAVASRVIVVATHFSPLDEARAALRASDCPLALPSPCALGEAVALLVGAVCCCAVAGCDGAFDAGTPAGARAFAIASDPTATRSASVAGDWTTASVVLLHAVIVIFSEYSPGAVNIHDSVPSVCSPNGRIE